MNVYTNEAIDQVFALVIDGQLTTDEAADLFAESIDNPQKRQGLLTVLQSIQNL
jgi:hypothetical protein